jgi:uncharacterized membrane protein
LTCFQINKNVERQIKLFFPTTPNDSSGYIPQSNIH